MHASMKTMAGRSKFSINGCVIEIDSIYIDLVFSYIMEALVDDPKTWHFFLTYFERIIKGESAAETETVLEDKDQDSYTTKQPSTHSASKFPISRISQASSLFLLLKDIISKHCKSININAAELLFGYILDALMDTPKGKERILSCLQRVNQAMYLNPKGVSNPKGDTVLEDKAHDCDTTKALCQKPPTQAASTSSTRKKSKVFKIYDNIKTINLCELVNRCEAISETPQGEKRLLSQLRRKKVSFMHCSIIDPAKATFLCCEAFCPPDLAHCDERSSRRLPLCNNCVSPTKLIEGKNQFCANTALDFYNAKHGTMFKLVKSLESTIVPISFGIYRFSCNFKAKLEKNDCSPKLFFGELVCSNRSTDVGFSKDENRRVSETAEGLVYHT